MISIFLIAAIAVVDNGAKPAPTATTTSSSATDTRSPVTETVPPVTETVPAVTETVSRETAKPEKKLVAAKPKPKELEVSLGSQSATLPTGTSGFLAVLVNGIILMAKPVGDGTFSLRVPAALSSKDLQALFPPAVVPATGALTLKWEDTLPEVRKAVTEQAEAFSRQSAAHKLSQQHEAMLTQIGKIQTDFVSASKDRKDLFVSLRAAAWTLAVLLIILGLLPAAVLEKNRRRVASTVEQARDHYPDLAGTWRRWTLEEWFSQSKKVAARRESYDAATKLLLDNDDTRGVERFVQDSTNSLRAVHGLLFGIKQTSWNSVLTDIASAVGGSAPGLQLSAARTNRGLIAEIAEAEGIRAQLNKRVEDGEGLKKRLEGLESLIAACHLPEIPCPEDIRNATKRVKDALSVLHEIEALGETDPNQWVSDMVTCRLELVESKKELEKCRDDIESVQQQIEVTKGDANDAEERALIHLEARRRVLTRLALRSSDGDVETLTSQADGLQGTAWVDHLDLLAVRESWEERIARISPSLTQLLRLADLPGEVDEALNRLQEMQAGSAPAIKPEIPVWRLFDHMCRIIEFRQSYDLTELDELRPRLELVTTVLRERMKSSGIVFLRPKLLTKDLRGFPYDNKDEPLKADERIGERIRRELIRSGSEFIVDVLHSEVRRGEEIVRPGHCVLVSPVNWG
jgi:hypothetical protein